MEDRTGGLCSVTAGHYSIMHRFRFFNVYEFQCSDSSTHLRFVTRPSPLGHLKPRRHAPLVTCHSPLSHNARRTSWLPPCRHALH